MDITKTEALIARMQRAGWDITPNAYKYAFAGTYVSVTAADDGSVFVAKGAPQVNLNLARGIAAYLTAQDGFTDVVVGPQKRGGDIQVTFRCAGMTGTWTG